MAARQTEQQVRAAAFDFGSKEAGSREEAVSPPPSTTAAALEAERQELRGRLEAALFDFGRRPAAPQP